MTKNELKYYSSLQKKKYRRMEKKFPVEGAKLIKEALEADYPCDIVFYTNQFEEKSEEFLEYLKKKGCNSKLITQRELERLSDTESPQGIIGFFMEKDFSFSVSNSRFLLALEDISDPGNMGTIARNADWFGLGKIIISRDCAEIFNPKVIRASAGSIFHVEILRPDDFYEFLSELKKVKYTILTADLTGENIYDFKPEGKIVLVLANEANGPTELLKSITDKYLTIPGYGKAESLNVASASAVLISELVRRV
ncbi:TrmH family RNA methyltransferase [Melioribacter sp. OK-6-Me]|uniref:TrmH family RNA methyltransferase n=1 Tax=unclassified Melioribacter TaxID=2627329 RepID=UPI003ED87391